jgi:hypothetical protein
MGQFIPGLKSGDFLSSTIKKMLPCHLATVARGAFFPFFIGSLQMA